MTDTETVAVEEPRQSEMIERVARALCLARCLDPDQIVAVGHAPVLFDGRFHVVSTYGQPLWTHLWMDAVAAIKAMGEPTEAMLDAAESAHNDYEAVTGKPIGPHEVFAAMIKSALNNYA